MNNCAFIGRLTADVELRRTGSGKAVASYSLAVKRPRVADTTDFIEFVSWEQGAEYLAKYAHKGDIVGVVGTLQPREWTDKEGNKRKAWEVVTTTVELLSSRKNDQGNQNPQQSQNGYPGGYGQPQGGFQQPQSNRQGFGGYQQQGFGGYHAPQQNDYPQLDGDDPKLPF